MLNLMYNTCPPVFRAYFHCMPKNNPNMNSNSHVFKMLYLYDVIINDFGSEMYTIDHLVIVLILVSNKYHIDKSFLSL
jgi:hypothetical protein